MKTKLIAILLLFMMQSSIIDAAGIPTVDVTNILQTTVSAGRNVAQVNNQVEQIENQMAQFDKLQEQLSQQIAHFEAITGNYNMGELLNTEEFRNARRNIPTTWQETLELLEGARAAMHHRQTQQVARRAQETGEWFPTEDLYDNAAAPAAVAHANEARSIFTHIGVGQSNFQQTDQRMTNLEALAAEIDQATDMKAAMDLQNRILTEQAILTAELIRLVAASQINSAEQRLNDHNSQSDAIRRAAGDIPTFPELGDDEDQLRNNNSIRE